MESKLSKGFWNFKGYARTRWHVLLVATSNSNAFAIFIVYMENYKESVNVIELPETIGIPPLDQMKLLK